MRVAFYGRVSTEEQADRGNITNQVEFAKKYFELHGPAEQVDGYDLYLDEGISGTIPLADRPEGARMLADAYAGKFTVVYFYRLDRLARSTQVVLNTYYDLDKLNISIKSMTEAFDTGTPVGKFFMTLLASIAALERDTILERTQLGKERKAREGCWTSGPPPYGYRINDERRLEIYEPEAQIIKLIFKLYIQGMHMSAISDYLNARSIPTPVYSKGFKGNSGGLWQNSHISIILRNPVYTGEYKTMRRSNKKKEGIVIQVPAIISIEEFNEAAAVIEKNTVGKRTDRSREYILRGVIRCGHCGYTYIGNIKSSGNKYYRCGNRNGGPEKCTNKQIKAEPLEKAIWEEIIYFIKNPQMVMNLIKERIVQTEINIDPARDELKKIEEAILQKKSARSRVISMVSKGHITEHEAEPELKMTAKDIAVLERRRGELFTVLNIAQTEKSTATDLALALEKYQDAVEESKPDEEIIKLLVERVDVYTEERDGKRMSRVVVNYRFTPQGKENSMGVLNESSRRC